jgi:hypothetical protein
MIEQPFTCLPTGETFLFACVTQACGALEKSRAMLQDALKFTQQSAALKSPLQQQAQNNVAAIKRQLGTAATVQAR